MIKRVIITAIIFLVFGHLLPEQIRSLGDLKKEYPEMKVFNERTINQLGYRLIQCGEINKAIEVLDLNTRLYPESWNVYDSLAEALMKDGKVELAIKNCSKSLELNPKNINGRRMLQKLVHPELAPYTGGFEYYYQNRYHILSIYIDEGKLVCKQSRLNPSLMIPAQGKTEFFTSKNKGETWQFVFIKDSTGFPSSFKWIKGATTHTVNRIPATVLRDKYSVQALKDDFRQFRFLIETVSANPYAFITQKEFNKLFEKGIQTINKPMSLQEFYTLLVPLKARIGCGHTHLDYPEEYRRTIQNSKFPLILSFLNNRCYVKNNLKSKPEIFPYSEIFSINSVKIPQIIATLKADISADGYNDYFKGAALDDCFQYYYANRYGSPKEFQIKLSLEGTSETQNICISAKSCTTVNYSNKAPSRLLFKVLPQQNTAIMTLDSFIYYGKRNKIFFDYTDNAFSRMKEEKVGNLIIDLRGNGGGDPFCASYLLSYIEGKPTIYFSQPYGKYARLAKPIPPAQNNFKGKIYMLIDGSNFSTTSHFLSIVKYHNLATLVGTESGGTYTCNSAVKGFHLKNTRILLKLSTKSFATEVKGLPPDRGIIPDYVVQPSIDDLKKGKDPVMAYTLNLINTKRKR
jgi:hypothetical protein